MADKNGRNEYLSWLALITLVGLCLFLRFPDLFKTPNSKVIEPWGDGFKTYLALVYHVRYDSSYTRLEAMNYPYGEHVIPGDAQPAISNTLKAISKRIPELADYGIAGLHFSLLFSLAWCVIFLYVLFRRLGLPAWYSIPISLAITFLSPPSERLISHYGLAHPAALTALLYGLLKWEERHHWSTSLGIALLIWFFSLIHFYFFAILSFTVAGYFAFSWLIQRRWALLPRYAMHFAVQVLLPFVFFWWWMMAGDPVTDRTSSPWGFLNYNTRPEGVFTSLTQPHFRWIHEHIIAIKQVDYEGKSYIGIVALVGFLILIGQVAGSLFRRLSQSPKVAQSHSRIVAQSQSPLLPVQIEGRRSVYLNALFFTGLALFIFATGFPFAIKGLEFLLDYTGPLKQFRSIGRFAWVFYFSSNIIAFVLLYRWMSRGADWRKGLVIAAVLVLSVEAWFFTRSFDCRLDDIEELNPGHRYTDLKINYSEYQAILPVPYYNIGSDNFWWALSGFIGQKTQTLAMQSGLPSTGAMLTRTSLSQTIKQLQLVMEPYRLPLILDDFPNKKPLLLAWDEERVAEGPFDYRHLLEDAQLIYENPPLRLYRLPLQLFSKRVEVRRAAVTQVLAADSLLYRTNSGLLASAPDSGFVYQSFDDQRASQVYMGQGAWEASAADGVTLFEDTLPTQQSNQYVFSVWMHLQADLHPRTDIAIVEYDEKTGQEVHRRDAQVREWVQTFDNNGWGLLEWTFNLSAPGNRIAIYLKNKALKKQNLHLDELLIRPAGLNLYKRADKWVFYNNRWY